MDTVSWRSASIYAPRGLGIYSRDFSKLLKDIQKMSAKEKHDRLSQEADGIGPCTDPMRSAYKVAVLMLRDYLASGHLVDVRDGDCRVINPADMAESSPEKVNEILKRQNQLLRNNALANGYANSSITAIESFLSREIGYESKSLAASLATEAPQIEVKRAGSGKSVDRDLFRAVRATWSMAPDRSAPGREESFVATDQRNPTTPLGIFQYRNIVPEIRSRDLWVGITTDRESTNLGFASHVLGRDGKEKLDATANTFKALLRYVISEGLPHNGKRHQDPLGYSKALDKVRADARASGLAARQAGDKAEQMKFLAIEKRCETSSALSRGIFGIQELSQSDDAAHRLRTDQELRRHIDAGLRKVWHYHMGFAFIELSICGAAPPFGPLRVGKLMALLALSDEALGQWGYDRPLGEIARMVFQEEVRDAVPNPGPLAVFTSGLYPGHSAQYNRARIGKFRWKRIGATSGYGSSHISVETTGAIDEFNNLSDGYSHITRTFGEGSGARFRAVGRAIGRLGIPDLRKHNVNRPVYAAALVPDVLGVLLGWSREHWALVRAEEVTEIWWREMVQRRSSELVARSLKEADLPSTLASILRATGKQIPAVQGTLS